VILGDRRGIVFPEVEVDDPQLGRIADQFHGAVDAQLVHDAGPVVFDVLGADEQIEKLFLPGVDSVYLTFSENGYGEDRCHKHIFLGSRFCGDILNVLANRRALARPC
jgi:hypothetical protein